MSDCSPSPHFYFIVFFFSNVFGAQGGDSSCIFYADHTVTMMVMVMIMIMISLVQCRYGHIIMFMVILSHPLSYGTLVSTRVFACFQNCAWIGGRRSYQNLPDSFAT